MLQFWDARAMLYVFRLAAYVCASSDAGQIPLIRHLCAPARATVPRQAAWHVPADHPMRQRGESNTSIHSARVFYPLDSHKHLVCA